jgi:hypothetical protein
MKNFSMRKTTLFKVAVVALLGIALHGCKKPSNGIDNNAVITKPYVLYVGDSFGNIYHTNGDLLNNNSDPADLLFKRLDFSSDGTPVRAISTSGNNLLMIKHNAYVRVGTDKNFNPFFNEGKLDPAAWYQSQIFDVPSFKRIYIAAPNTGGNGVYYSDTNGALSTWINDNDVSLTSAVTSYTQLEDGTLIAFSDVGRTVYTKSSTTTPWVPVAGSGLPTGGKFFVSHLKNMIVAADCQGGTGDVYYSSNHGLSWQKFNGLPPVNILSMTPAFEQALIVGTDGEGIYRLTISGATFLSANTGIGAHAKVTGLTEKYNQYKNGQIKQYVYAATDKGLYRSEDLGLNWVQIISTTLPATNFTAVY